jgi:intracellular septation protein A
MFFARAFKPILLDLASTIFFVAIFWATGNIYVATAAGIAAGVSRVGFLKFRGRAITPLQWLSLGLVVVFGTTTLVTHNPHFVMVKPTLVFFAVGIVMLTTDWLKPYLPSEFSENVCETHIALVSRLWGALLILLGVANCAAAFLFEPKIWALYAASVPTVFQVAGALATYFVLNALARRAPRQRTPQTI